MSKKSILRKSLKWLGGLLLLAIVATWLILSFFSEDIQQGIISSLEEEYGIEVDYSRTRLDLWKSFPNLSLRVEDFVVAYSDSSRPAMMDVSGFYASVSLPSLISGRYSIKEIFLENGRVNVNMEDLSGSSGNGSFKPGSMELGLLKMKNVQLGIGSTEQAEMLSIFLHKGIFKIKDEKGRLSVKLMAEALPHFALSSLENILGGEEHQISLEASFDPGNNNFSIQNGSLNVSGNEFLLDLSLDEESYKLMLESREANVAGLSSLFTEYLKEFEGEVQLNGMMNARVSFTGKYSDHVPEIAVDFRLSEAKLLLTGSALQLSIDELFAEFQNHASETLSDFELNITDFTLHNDFLNMQGLGFIRNFDAPMIGLDIHSEIQLSKLPASIADSLQFRLEQGALFLKTEWERKRPGWNALQPQDLIYSRMQSEFKLQDLLISQEEEEKAFRISKAAGSFNNNDLMIDSLFLHKGRNDIAMHISFRRFFSFLLMPQDEETYHAEVKLQAEKLYPQDLLMTNPADTSNSLNFYSGFVVSAFVEADSLLFRKFRAAHVVGSLILQKDEWQASSLDFSAWDGENQIKASLKRMQQGFELEAEALLKGVNVKKLFFELDDFGQEVISFRNVDGRLNASLHLESMMDGNLNIIEDSVRSVAELSIIHGRLSDFEPLISSLSFLEEAELRQIDFDTLKNRIEIRDRKVFIPEMEIRSSLMDFEGYGIHGFDNQIDYHMRVLLSEVLSGRAKEKRTNFNDYAYIEDDGLGRTSLFLKITGSAADPEFDYDRKAVARKIKEDFNREKRNFSEALKNEFHWLSRDSLKKQENEKRKEWIRKQEEGKFIFEWDADSTNEFEQK